jgi:hypothetical protein
MKSLVLLALICVSCSSSKIAQRSLARAKKHGYSCSQVNDTIQVFKSDTIIKIVNGDTIREVVYSRGDTIIKKFVEFVPLTKWQTKTMYKHIIKIKKIDARQKKVALKNERKVIKNKPLKPLINIVIVAVVFFLFLCLIKFFKDLFK